MGDGYRRKVLRLLTNFACLTIRKGRWIFYKSGGGPLGSVAAEVEAMGVRAMDAGALYRLDIPDDVMPHLLDWDNRIAQQPTIIKTVGWRVESRGNKQIGSSRNQTP